MRCLAIDGGTTNTRIVVLDDQTPLAVSRHRVGARDIARRSTADTLTHALREGIDYVLTEAGVELDSIQFIAVSGMLTSNVGLIDLPHLTAPVSLDDLAQGVHQQLFADLCPKPFFFVRGVKQPPIPELDDPGDMMRGEETETFGLLSLLRIEGPAHLVLPGSHTKVVTVDGDQRLCEIRTFMTGEIIDSLAQHTVLAGSMPASMPSEVHLEALERGARWARHSGVSGSAFRVRLAQVLECKSPEYCAGLLVGIVVGNDVQEWVRKCDGNLTCPIYVAGSNPLRAVFAHLLQSELADHGVKVHEVRETMCQMAVPVGASLIVRRHTEM